MRRIKVISLKEVRVRLRFTINPSCKSLINSAVPAVEMKLEESIRGKLLSASLAEFVLNVHEISLTKVTKFSHKTSERIMVIMTVIKIIIKIQQRR